MFEELGVAVSGPGQGLVSAAYLLRQARIVAPGEEHRHEDHQTGPQASEAQGEEPVPLPDRCHDEEGR